MLKDSSKLPQVQPRENKGASIALLTLFTVVLLFFVAQVIGGSILNLVPAVRHWSDARANDWLNNSVAAQFLYVLIADGLLIAGVAGALRFFRWSWKTIGLTTPTVRNVILGVVAVVPYYFVYIVMVYALKALVPALNIDQKQDIGFESVHGALALVFTFTSLVVIPPLAEEIAMRGFLYTGLKKWLPKIAAALLVSVLFGAAHLLEGGASGPLWIGAIDTFTLSLVLVFLRERTGNLWAGITLHAVKNGIAFLLLFVIGGR